MEIKFTRHLLRRLLYLRREISPEMIIDAINKYDLIKPSQIPNRRLYFKFHPNKDKFLCVVVENSLWALTAYFIDKRRVI